MLLRSRRSLAVMCLVVLAGCGVDHGRSAPQPRHFGRADYVRFFRRPASFRAEELLIEDAEHRLTERCMARNGHHVRFAPARIPGTAGWIRPSLRFRRRHGYGFATFRTPRPDEYVPATQTDRDALAHKYFGNEGRVARVRTPARVIEVGVEGCIGQARRLLAGSVEQWVVALSLPRDWSAYLGPKVGHDPAYLGAPMHRWARCMATHGYRDQHYRTLNGPYLQAWHAFQRAHGPEHPPAWEIHLAVTDATCQNATHLDAATKDIQDRLIDALPYRDRRHLRHIAAVRAHVVANAHKVLPHHP